MGPNDSTVSFCRATLLDDFAHEGYLRVWGLRGPLLGTVHTDPEWHSTVQQWKPRLVPLTRRIIIGTHVHVFFVHVNLFPTDIALHLVDAFAPGYAEFFYGLERNLGYYPPRENITFTSLPFSHLFR